jgi:hypothetical protein
MAYLVCIRRSHWRPVASLVFSWKKLGVVSCPVRPSGPILVATMPKTKVSIVAGRSRKNARTAARMRKRVWAVPCDRLSLPLGSSCEEAPRQDGLPCRPLGGGVWASPLPRWPPVLWLQKCYLPILRSGHMGIGGVTLRHFERRALMLFRSAKSWTERQLKQAAWG